MKACNNITVVVVVILLFIKLFYKVFSEKNNNDATHSAFSMSLIAFGESLKYALIAMLTKSELGISSNWMNLSRLMIPCKTLLTISLRPQFCSQFHDAFEFVSILINIALNLKFSIENFMKNIDTLFLRTVYISTINSKFYLATHFIFFFIQIFIK